MVNEVSIYYDYDGNTPLIGVKYEGSNSLVLTLFPDDALRLAARLLVVALEAKAVME